MLDSQSDLFDRTEPWGKGSDNMCDDASTNAEYGEAGGNVKEEGPDREGC